MCQTIHCGSKLKDTMKSKLMTNVLLVSSFLVFSLVTENNAFDLKSFAKTIPNSLPTPSRFLEILLNATFAEVLKLAEDFQFTKVNASEIYYLQYFGDGSYNRVDAETAKIDLSQPIKVVIHGWSSRGNASWVKEIAESYHKVGINNTISVDWGYFANQNYLGAATSTKDVGENAAKFIYNLVKKDVSKLKNVHVIGHSLGAQTAGFVGQHIQTLSGGSFIFRITALDAAAPFFEFPIRVPSSLRINEQDAVFVDSIHTNSGLLGFLSSFANQDHYVDFGGPIQPGCLTSINILESILCSHQKSHEIFRNTITSKDYVSLNCIGPVLLIVNKCTENPKVIMGEHNNGTSQSNLDGNYYVGVTDKNTPETLPGKSILGNIVDVLKTLF